MLPEEIALTTSSLNELNQKSASESIIELEGLERMFTMSPNCSSKIAHVFTLEGPVNYIIQHLPQAFLTIINQHPKMRVKQSKMDPFKAIVCPLMALDQVHSLIRIIHEPVDWNVYVQEECERPFHRQENIPYYLTLIKETDQECHLILFSDHYMSDGYSGMIIMDGIFKQLACPSKVSSAPLTPSAYSKIVTNRFQKWRDYAALNLIQPFVIREMNKRKFHLPISESCLKHSNTVPSPSYAKFASGNNDNLVKNVAKCKEEKVTLHGPIAAAIQLALAAMYPSRQEKFKCTLDIAINMRKRYANPFKEDVVGLHVENHSLEYFEKKGFSLNDKFWNVARLCKKETDSFSLDIINRAILQFIHEKMAAKSSDMPLKLNRRTLSDLTISNLGKYPYSLTHSLPEGPLTAKNLHLYNSFPIYGSTICFFITCTEQMGYSMSHRTEDSLATQLFEQAVHIMENLWKIESHESMAQVMERFKI